MSNVKTWSDLYKYHAELHNISNKKANEEVKRVYETMMQLVNAGEGVPLGYIGYLEVVEKKSRTGRNPRTGESVEIPAHKTMTFKQSKRIKDILNGAK